MGNSVPDVRFLVPEPDTALAAARSAGWRGCDLGWERLQERAHEALRSGDTAYAARLWRRAWWLALLRIPRGDPRYATSLANAGMAARLAGNETDAICATLSPAARSGAVRCAIAKCAVTAR